MAVAILILCILALLIGISLLLTTTLYLPYQLKRPQPTTTFAPVDAASTCDIRLRERPLPMIDGVTLRPGDRVLLKDQRDGRENGIWQMDMMGTLSRSPDYRVVEGATVFVRRGEQQKDQTFVLRNLSNVRGLADSPGTAEVYFLPILQHLFGPAHLPRNHILQINHRGLATWNTSDEVSKLAKTTGAVQNIPFKLHTLYGMWDSCGHPNMTAWEEMNPEYQVRIWTPDVCIALLRAHYDHLVDWFEQAKPIVRVDGMRWLILYHEGGVLIDQDTEPKTSMAKILEDAQNPRVLLVSEKGRLVTHCAAMSQRNPFAHFMMQRVFVPSEESTEVGQASAVLTDVYEKYGKDFNDLVIVPGDEWLFHGEERAWIKRTSDDVVIKSTE